MAKFTCKSENDKHLVTISVPEWEGKRVSAKRKKLLYRKGMSYTCTVNGLLTVFTVNRDGESLSTRAFPRGLEMPTVGNPVFYEVK